jgi:lon-related putative ATP-dependent protease
MARIQELAPEQLYRRCDPALLNFATTADLPDLNEVIGQPRAVAAVQLGIGMRRDGFNIFAFGPAGTGKQSLVRHFLEERAAKDPVPSDWCYVNNFEQPWKPRALRLPSGRGIKLRRDMEELVRELRTALAGAFESDEYRGRRQVIEHEFKETQDRALGELNKKAQENSLVLLRTPAGLIFAPIVGGEVMSPEDYQKLPEETRQKIEADMQALQEELQEMLAQVPKGQRQVRTRVGELNREFTNLAIGALFQETRAKYEDLPDVVNYLNAVQHDVTETAPSFVSPQEAPPEGQPAEDERETTPEGSTGLPPVQRRYLVNLLVDHSGDSAAPVVHEDNPTYQNLVGRTEHLAQMGALVTDFNLIKPGALHRANGGYLVLDAVKVLQQPYAWDALKRSLLSEQITTESLGQALSMISTISLEPQPIPLDLKVVLLGERQIYYALAQADPDFDRLFKVAADFGEEMPRDQESQELYARLIATLARKHELRALDAGAVARVIEHSARAAGDENKLSLQTRRVRDLISEADYWAAEAGHSVVERADVQKAIDEQIFRADRVRERLYEEIQQNTIFIDTTGSATGQINGLSVLQAGNYAFGQPSRITARVRLGDGQVVNIEREVELSGPIHSKGVLILAGFLGARYAGERPLSLAASLVFEQSYGGVEGDSASSAELYALLSAISSLPVKQSLAVTGSVSQNGQIQAIGGANEKIEGFFDICRARGLTGDQGVLIPASNVRHLMLRGDVVQAVADGRFHVYPVQTVDEGIELLTGAPAGERSADGNYPAESVNGRVQARLDYLAERRLEFGAARDGNGPHAEKERGKGAA